MQLMSKTIVQKITPHLWFDDDAEEAAKFYTSIFRNSRIINVTRYGHAGSRASGRAEGSVMTVLFELEGQRFMALNGGPVFKFTPAISFMVHCETQEEVDEFWEKLSQGGEIVQCGWLNDKYGVSWQIVPNILGELISDKDAKKSERVMEAMLQMKKLDIKQLEKAHGGY
jgi:predicted 3-demethylubiquinone-9 3-methyltransferase (glyoxalase superfamily)